MTRKRTGVNRGTQAAILRRELAKKNLIERDIERASRHRADELPNVANGGAVLMKEQIPERIPRHRVRAAVPIAAAQ